MVLLCIAVRVVLHLTIARLSFINILVKIPAEVEQLHALLDNLSAHQ